MKKKWLIGLLVYVVLAVVLRAVLVKPPTVHVLPDTVYTNVSVRSAAVVETVTKVLTRFKVQQESVLVNIHDTVAIKEFIRQTDTVVVACTRCVAQLALLRHVSDSIITARDDTIYALRTRLQKCQGARPWWAAAGLGAGVLACRR
jgi:uncharacterized membrane protein